MKAGILYAAKDIRLGKAPKPITQPDEVLLESQAAGICGTDLHIYHSEFAGRVSYPAILGHEFGGVIATVNKPFFRQILDFSRAHYETDRATNHLSGILDKVPPSASLNDKKLLGLFEQFDTRQVLRVTFGSVLDEFGGRLREILKANQGLYQQFLLKHFRRHLKPFS
jgi:hypothetical protein